MTPFFISIPHSGEEIPQEVTWLKGLDEAHLMRDVDRFVDRLYKTAIDDLKLPAIVTKWHRYVIDLNRKPDEVDCDSVQGSTNPSGTHPKGLHWSVTTFGEKLISEPMSMELHQKLVKDYYQPFHDSLKQKFDEFKAQGFSHVFQLDAHSMPSEGTRLHKDYGEKRAEVVISDGPDKSCMPEYRDLVVSAYKNQGFEVRLNWPYIGGGITQTYGHPELGQNTIQVELNRKLYMNEETKAIIPERADPLSEALGRALKEIKSGISQLPGVSD